MSKPFSEKYNAKTLAAMHKSEADESIQTERAAEIREGFILEQASFTESELQSELIEAFDGVIGNRRAALDGMSPFHGSVGRRPRI